MQPLYRVGVETGLDASKQLSGIKCKSLEFSYTRSGISYLVTLRSVADLMAVNWDVDPIGFVTCHRHSPKAQHKILLVRVSLLSPLSKLFLSRWAKNLKQSNRADARW